MAARFAKSHGLTFPDDATWKMLRRWSEVTRAGDVGAVHEILQQIVARDDEASVLGNVSLLSTAVLLSTVEDNPSPDVLTRLVDDWYPTLSLSFPVTKEEFNIIAYARATGAPVPDSFSDDTFALGTIALFLVLADQSDPSWETLRAGLAKSYE